MEAKTEACELVSFRVDQKMRTKQIRTKRFMLRDEKRLTARKNKPIIPRNKQPKVRDRSVNKLRETMQNLGVDMSGSKNANFTKSVVDLRRCRRKDRWSILVKL